MLSHNVWKFVCPINMLFSHKNYSIYENWPKLQCVLARKLNVMFNLSEMIWKLSITCTSKPITIRIIWILPVVLTFTKDYRACLLINCHSSVAMALFLHSTQTVVIVSSHKHTLTATTHIIFAMLHPFRWNIQIKCVNEFMVVIKLQQNCNYVRFGSFSCFGFCRCVILRLGIWNCLGLFFSVTNRIFNANTQDETL